MLWLQISHNGFINLKNTNQLIKSNSLLCNPSDLQSMYDHHYVSSQYIGNCQINC